MKIVGFNNPVLVCSVVFKGGAYGNPRYVEEVIFSRLVEKSEMCEVVEEAGLSIFHLFDLSKMSEESLARFMVNGISRR